MMSGFDFPIRRIGEGRKSGLKRRSKMARFMYLFRSNPTAYRSMSPEQIAKC